MLFLLSPARSLDFETPAPLEPAGSTPRFCDRAAELADVQRQRSPQQIARPMQLGDRLAALNAARFANWSRRHTASRSKPAALALDGEVHRGLGARTLSAADLQWAQRHVCIASGLHGVLRPLDRIQPHRLEMGTKLATADGIHHNLYQFWGRRIAEHLNRRLRGHAQPIVVNLASSEYSKAVDRAALEARVIDCVFEQSHGGEPRVIGVYAKRARGLMARWAILRRAADPAALEAFDFEGCACEPDACHADRLVFRRRSAAPDGRRKILQ